MIEYSLYVRRYAPFKSFGGGFEGDDRGFSTSLSVTSRTIGVATFSPQAGNLPLKDIMLPKMVASGIDKVVGVIRPKARHLQGTPDIDTFVDFAATFRGNKVVFEGIVRGDGFPNAEVFVLDAQSKAVGLLDYRTKSGEMGPPYRLLGSGSGHQIATFRQEVTLNANGLFTGSFTQPPKVVVES